MKTNLYSIIFVSSMFDYIQNSPQNTTFLLVALHYITSFLFDA